MVCIMSIRASSSDTWSTEMALLSSGFPCMGRRCCERWAEGKLLEMGGLCAFYLTIK